MYAELQLDFTNYDENFMDVIDALIILHFGKEGAEIIGYFLWEKENPDGTINVLENEEGEQVTLETAVDLWNLLLRMNPNYGN
jgi:hypothetical protein